MTRMKKGGFRDKHPDDVVVDQAVMAAVTAKMKNKKIACKTAFGIAESLSSEPMDVGTAIDLHEGRIVACQLGLFGHGKDKKMLKGSLPVDESLRNAIHGSTEKGRLPCEKAWRIADEQRMTRLEIAHACESLGIRICRCQLGAFK